MVQKICLIGFLSVLVLVVLFQHAIQLMAFEWAIQTYIVHHFGRNLTYQRAYLEEGRLIIQSPHFKSDPAFQAEQMTVGYQIDPWRLQLALSLVLERPSWQLGKMEKVEWERGWEFFNVRKTWFQIHPSLQIKEGCVSWESSEEPRVHQLLIDVDVNSRLGGYIHTYLGGILKDKNCVLIQASSSADAVQMSWKCKEANCASLMALIRLFYPHLKSWQIPFGHLNGEVKAIFPSHQRPYLEGEMLIEKMVFRQESAHLTGSIEEARLKLARNSHFGQSPELSSTTIGQLDILQPASLAYDGPNQTSWQIDHLEGYAQIDGVKEAKLAFEAQGHYQQHHSHFSLQGEAHLNDQKSLNLDLDLFCSSVGCPDGKIHLLLHPMAENRKFVEVKLKKMSYVECGFLQTLMATYWPQAKSVELQRGNFEAALSAQLSDRGIEDLHFEHLRATNFQFRLLSLATTCSFSQANGHGSIQLTGPQIWDSLNADLDLDNGFIQLDSLYSNLPLTAIQTRLKIKSGRIPHALVTLNLAGLKGFMDIEWGQHKELITIKLDGHVQDLTELFPVNLQEGLRTQFKDHRLGVLANVRQQAQQLELVGSVHVQASQSEQVDLIHFGCDFKYIPQEIEKKLAPLGWFYSRNLPLEKFISPFIFRQGSLRMWGKGEVKGSFDHQTLTVKYDVDNLKIENEDLLIEAKQLRSSVPGQLIGFHQFDLKTHSHRGVLPIQRGSYFEKNSGLYFNDIQGTVLFNDQALHIRSLEAYCHDVYFAGCLDLDYSDPAPGVFSVAIKSPIFSGKVSQIQSLLSHLNPSSPLYKIPLEGDMSGKSKGLSLLFDFFPQDYHLQADCQGTINNGFLSAESADMSLKGLYMDFDYHHAQECLEFTDIQGSLLIGKPRCVEEYLFGGHHIRFQGIERQNLDLDIWVKDREEELARLAAFTRDREGQIKELLVDSTLSHISQLYPQQIVCEIKEWSTVAAFKCEAQFDLGLLLKDLKRFRQTGLLFLSHQFLAKLERFDQLEGMMHLLLHYDPIDGSYDYALKSANIKLPSSPLHACFLKGKKQDKRWVIDPFQWDQFTVFADLQQASDKWKINFLGLNDGQSLLLGLEGNVFPEEACLEAKVKLGEVNLSGLGHWEALKAFATKWQPQGSLHMTGEMKLTYLSTFPWYDMQADLSANVQQLAFRGCPFYIDRPLRLQFQSNQRVQFEDIHIKLKRGLNQLASVFLKELIYDSGQDQLSCPYLFFKCPCQSIQELGDTLQRHFPDLMDEGLKQVVVNAKTQEEFAGKLEFKIHPQGQRLSLALADGNYVFKKRSYNLKNFEMKIFNEQLTFSALSFQERCPFELKGSANWPALDRGEYTLYDQLSQSGFSSPLTIQWQNHPIRGFIFQSIKGHFCGLSCSLNAWDAKDMARDWATLQGKVAVDFNKLCPLLDLSLVEKIQQLEMGSTYVFSGHYWLNPTAGTTLLDGLFFQGFLASQEPILKGYQLEQLKAEANYSPKHLELRNLTIKDAAGTVTGDKLTALEDEETKEWWLSVPRLIVKNLKPSFLREIGRGAAASPKFKTLLIRRIDLQDFYGNLNQLPTWQAQGSLHFQNPSRKNIYHPLLAIPAEIILRLGLDPQVLNPVTGTIYFDMRGDRFYLAKFKDVYSEGRGSKFYLASTPTPSWMDMKGNLSVQIRMKQYNLIFKIAELFTVSIQGNIKKPKYTLQKQGKASRKGQPLSLTSE